MELFINKISHYLPDSVVPNSYFKEVNGLDDEWIYSRTGIKNRSKAAANENTNTMGIKAVDLATTDLPYPMEEIDLIIAATYSPYDTVATPAHMVQRRYHIEHAKCVSVSSACSSFINAMEIAQGYFALGKATKALIIGAEHNTAYANENDPQSGHLWGDGAVAFFVSAGNYSGHIPELSISIPKVWDTSAKQPKRCISAHRTVASECLKDAMYLSMPVIIWSKL